MPNIVNSNQYRNYVRVESNCIRIKTVKKLTRSVSADSKIDELKRRNAVADIVTLYVLIDDAPAYCSHFYCSGVGDEERTEVYVIPRSEFAKWLEVEKTMPKEGVKLYETP